MHGKYRTLTVGLLTVLLAIPLVSAVAVAQTYTSIPEFNQVLLNQGGGLIQFSIETQGTQWFPTQQQQSYSFCTTCANVAGIQTVGGVSEIWVKDSRTVCSTNACTFLGTIGELRQESVTQGSTTFYRVSGDANGTFTDYNGTVYQNVPCRFYFETFPATDTAIQPAAGGITIVMQPN